ncbi:Carbohydrate sulfotransferase 1 [Mizuhopecten yessoensis]|uniref:Carbohydrate sulfotransferase 1 n=1 Tax=Mizuhopecten yessoensis TaxID=6573 RepID=A0A210Q5C9_MIZYE|nr:Carbohydrate sulfotransferase 1 [Mizuhopecten yessoensis]
MEYPIVCGKKSLCVLMSIAMLLCYYEYTRIDIKNEEKSLKQLQRGKTNKHSGENQTVVDFGVPIDDAEKRQDVPNVLLITYLRSGSSLIGDIVQQVPHALYSFEPAKQCMERGYYLSRDRGMCYLTNDVCKNTPKNDYGFIMEHFKNFYKCNLKTLNLYFLSRSRQFHKLAYQCKREANQKKCISKLIPVCEKAVRIIKTIRLSMDMVQELMENIPNLKVIHLLRDPRGMIVSRIKAIRHLQYKMGNMSSIARAVCDRYNRDISIGQSLKVKYPNRIKTVLYEQIAQRPLETSIRIFKFLGLQPKRNFKSWLMEHIAGDPKMSVGHPAFSTVRANSTVTANSWRIQLSLDNVMDIDRECSQVYEYTGYLAVKNSTVLKNLNISVRKKNTNFP